MNSNVELLDNQAIWRAADALRNSHELSGYATPPIDVIFIADVLLKFDLIDIPDMFADLRMDAAMVPAEHAIFIDRASLERWERNDKWIEKRLRFSVAHELGHFVLHKDYMADVHFSDFRQFKRWMLEHLQDKRSEDQANEFAGRFLVPINILQQEYDRFQKKMSTVDPAWHEVEGMRAHVAQIIAPRFNVNSLVIETRFDHEGIWPLE